MSMVPGAQPVSGPGQFSQRTDTSPGQPVRVPTGVPYGQAKQLEQAQQAVPLPASSGPGGPAPGPGAAGPGPAPGAAAPPVGTPGMPTGAPNEDALALLAHPTQRPNEAVTTLPPDLANPSASMGQLLNKLAASPMASAEVRRLASYVASGRQ